MSLMAATLASAGDFARPRVMVASAAKNEASAWACSTVGSTPSLGFALDGLLGGGACCPGLPKPMQPPMVASAPPPMLRGLATSLVGSLVF
eukprot:1867640-Rhodomonas_salina.1